MPVISLSNFHIAHSLWTICGKKYFQVWSRCELHVRHGLYSSSFCLLHDTSRHRQTTGDHLKRSLVQLFNFCENFRWPTMRTSNGRTTTVVPVWSTACRALSCANFFSSMGPMSMHRTFSARLPSTMPSRFVPEIDFLGRSNSHSSPLPGAQIWDNEVVTIVWCKSLVRVAIQGWCPSDSLPQGENIYIFTLLTVIFYPSV